MISVEIPGLGEIRLHSLVLDYNGTLALDGHLAEGVLERLNLLAKELKIYVITADTFGLAAAECKGLNGEVMILQNPLGAQEKEDFIMSLGAEQVAAVGNGVNDCLMLKKAALGIAVIGDEGASVKAVNAADIVVKDIRQALELLLHTKRLKATLRG
ncbi:HAD family hydrolase [Desulforamulus aeronauticus]|uniref:ATPase, P-type (Transporting), HAD superfamily, subfamily IC n=1 Tax=Desulforamulus aeronauticus DSM 10349 TaxID=1121421 RepID=A0A1M6VKY2_9FIRM|nr:HAD family hydrolase [Desulforamulus aeronauticus]SHK82163.1 ATPase, P-type (transporting), HAD superfamily, subfamily IC [Desulforamulus aeronauticus DSM 10349]